MAFEQRLQPRGIAGKLAAEFDSRIAGGGCVGQTGFKADLGTEMGQVVVTPDNRVDADGDVHRVLQRSPSFRR